MRIKMVTKESGPLLSRVLFRLMPGRKGKVPPPLRVYGWKPGILFTFLGLGRAVRHTGELPERLKRLAMYWTASQVECSF